MRVNNRGFSSVEILIVVVVIGLIGTLGWIAYERLQKDSGSSDKDTSSIQTDTEKEKENSPVDTTVDWKTETIEKYGISFKYPAEDGWSSTFGIVDSLLPGHEATISLNYTKCGPSCGFALSIGVFNKEFEASSQKDFGDERMKNNSHYTLTSKEAVTIDGVSGTRWEYTPDDDIVTTIIFYYFSNDAFSYSFAVNNNGAVTDEVDLTATGEKIVGTVQFLD